MQTALDRQDYSSNDVPGRRKGTACRTSDKLELPNVTALPGVPEVLSQRPPESMALIEGAQGQKSSIAGDLPAGKISADDLPTRPSLRCNVLQRAIGK
jgi:hypothetical protein